MNAWDFYVATLFVICVWHIINISINRKQWFSSAGAEGSVIAVIILHTVIITLSITYAVIRIFGLTNP